MREDLLLEQVEVRAGLQAEFIDERPSTATVGVERVGLAAGTVERKHQLPEQALAQWMLGDERLELGDDLRVAAELKVGVDPILKCGEPLLVETCNLGPRPLLVLELRQRPVTPERERAPKQRRRLASLARGRRVHESRELLRVRLPGDKQVSRSLRHDRLRGQRAAQLRYVSLQHFLRARRRASRPQLFDQTIRRHGLVRVHEQQREQCPLPTGPQQNLPAVLPDLQRAQKPESHGHAFEASAERSAAQAAVCTGGIPKTTVPRPGQAIVPPIGRTKRPRDRRRR